MQGEEMPGQPLSYEASGVSIDAQDQAIAAFKALVERTHGPEVLAGVGAFGAAFQPGLAGMSEPVLVSSTDGIGTKVRLHARFGTHGWAGADLVGAVMNDVLCSGARPLFFLDYLACHQVVPDVERQVVGGMAEVCAAIGCALIGGEIAEMGSTYHPGEYDLAGFGIGLVDRSKMLGADRVRPGDTLVAFPSSGVHCNGFALVRRVFEALPDEQWLAPYPGLPGNLRDTLLVPARSYAREMAGLFARFELHAAAHISGGGLIDNVPRVIPEGCTARVARSRIPVPPVFDIIARQGPVEPDEMWHVFNMGVGFVIAVPPESSDPILEFCREQGYGAMVIGDVARQDSGPRFEWID
jgi:phosphoribosylformylglycinamidine cyclo-ligase